MAEQTLANPLSGAEIIEAVLDKLRNKMRVDCYLNPNSAYDWFTAKVTVELDMHDTGAHIKATHTAEASHGVVPAVDDRLENGGDLIRDEFDIDAAPPNKVRVETGQPVPTLTKDENGRSVVKGVKRAREGVKAATR